MQYLGLRELGTSGEKIPLLSTANTWSARQTFSAGITGTLTGNADTATKLKTARTINGVSFDGSANISLSPANIGCPASPTGWLTTGNNGESITTAQLVTLLQNNGAFNTKAWFARCAWAYANSASIPDSETGCGIIPLAGAVIEVFSNNTNNYTIRITTATTTSVSGALTNAEFIYVSNGTSYSPGWRRAYNTKNKPTAADVGALPLSGGALTGGLTATGEIISKSANGLRIAYGNYGFFIRNDGSNTHFMLTDSGNSLGTYNRLRPLIINNANGAVTIGNGLNVTGGINGSLNGNAATATKLATARNINGVKFDGSGDVNINTLVSRGRVTALSGSTQGTAGIQMYEAYNNSYPTTYGNVLHMKGASATGEGELLIGWSGTSGAHAPVFIRSRRDNTDAAWSAWAQVYTSRDSIPGVNATGNQNTTGNAATATKLQTARTIGGVPFDGSANINLPGVNIAGNQNTTGNAATATKLQTACTINGVSFDGSGDVNINTLVSRGRVTALSGSTQGTAGIQMYEAYNNSYPTTYGNVLHMKGASATGEGELLIGWSGTSGAHAPVFIRSRRDNTDAAWSAWAQVYTSRDSIPGVNATGNQNTTGNAATATKLQTARTIGGVPFDGSANINLPGVNIAGNQNTTGNAATATKLQTACTINGVSFDGSKNIELTAEDLNL
ncbi:hypothetical protein POW98_26445, partial [Escherichia coli]